MEHYNRCNVFFFKCHLMAHEGYMTQSTCAIGCVLSPRWMLVEWPFTGSRTALSG